MDIELTAIETRVLGALIEKEMTTPDYYPLTLNALKSACNQKSNRFPVMSLDEKIILRTLDSLNNKGLASQFTRPEFRVPKYQHTIKDTFNLLDDRIALLSVLMLRGPQTIGELKIRTERMYEFENLQEIEEKLQKLSHHSQGPFVAQLERQPGQKEPRFAHLFSGLPEIESTLNITASDSARLEIIAENEQISKLENEMESLKNELQDLKKEFGLFKAQFE